MLGVTGKKNKEAGKGFEVVRASRIPPGMQPPPPEGDDVEMENSPPMNDEPYHDSADVQAAAGAERSVSPESIRQPGQPFNFGFGGNRESTLREPRQDSAMGLRAISHPGLRAELPSLRARPSQDNMGPPLQERPSSEYVQDQGPPYRISEVPSLAPIESVGGIDIPTRFNTQRTREQRDGDHQDQWLRDVDNLSYSHNRSTSQPLSSAPQPLSSRYYPPPSLPTRSARRPQSSDSNHLHPPQFSRSASGNSSASGNEFNQFDSSTGFYDIAVDEEEERPSSFMNTSHHRAADSIHRNSFGANAALQASSAEFMGSSPQEGSGFAQNYSRR